MTRTTSTRLPVQRPLAIALALLVVPAVALVAPAAQADPLQLVAKAAKKASDHVGHAKGRLLVQARAGLPDVELDKEVKGLGAKARDYASGFKIKVIELPPGADEVAALDKLQKSGKFKFAELDMAVEPAAIVSDPNYAKSWAPPKIGAQTAWDYSAGEGVIVAVLDTGVDSEHVDLAANMVPGWNTYDDNSDTRDVHGHGTKVSGVVAMIGNNGAGSAGVAHMAKVMPIRISDLKGYGYWSTVADGIRWAADNGARVVNVSFNGMAGSATIQAAADYMRSKGGLVMIASGNSAFETATAASNSVIVVSATDKVDNLATFSTYGGFVDLSAPGTEIFTTGPKNGYGAVSGTSLATPVVAATAALVMAANPELTADEVQEILFKSARDLGDAGKDKKFGHGRIDAEAAVVSAVLARGGEIILDKEAPVAKFTSPAGGTTLSGTASFDVSVLDNRGVASVEFYVNGKKVSTDLGLPFKFSLNTLNYADGDYSFYVKAVDTSGNTSVSPTLLAKISNAVVEPLPDGDAQDPLPLPDNGADTTAPVVGSFSLADGTVVSSLGSIQVTASATDNVGVVKMTLELDGVLKQNGTTSLNKTLYVNTLTAGVHTVTVKAWDKAGNLATRISTIIR